MKSIVILLFLSIGWSCAQSMDPPSAPTITMVTSQTTSIDLAWSQRAGDVVDIYTISYSYVTRGCEGSVRGEATLTEMDGSIRTYTLSDVEEDSDFDISITAVNEAGSSAVPARTSATTLVAAPSGIVASLMTTAITSTTVTLTWGRVTCRDRNVEITRYAIQYSPSSNSNDITGAFIMPIKTNNKYTITGLIPRTNYIMQVRADHSTFSTILQGTMIATVDAKTAVSTALGFLLMGTPYPNNSAVALTAIGAGNDALICITNLTACCRGDDTGGMGVLGIWRLPDRSLVPSFSGSTVSITRSRGPSAILLHRRGSAMGPTGVFTCEVPDASGICRSVYIYIYAGQVPGSLTITDFSYNRLVLVLTCTSSGRPTDSVTWLKDGSDIRRTSSEFSQTQNISDRVNATYQHLLSSRSAANFVGRFTCVVRDGSGGTASRTLTPNVPALGVVVFLRGNPIDSNFFTGLQLNLTCIINISPIELDIPTAVSVSAEWSKSGTSLTTSSRVTVDEELLEVEPLQYQTSLLFNSLDKTRDEGNYTCAVHVIHSLEGFPDVVTDSIASHYITVQTLFFQLKFTGVLNCESWRSVDLVSKGMDIVKAIVKSIAAMCDCDFTADRLTDRVFLCLPSSPQSITYQAQLHGTLQTPVEDLGIKIHEWALSGITIPVQLVPLKLEGACVSSTASTLECEATESTQMEDKNKVQFGTIIASVMSVVVVFVLIIIAVAIIVTVRIRHSKMKPKIEPRRVGAIPLSYVGTLTDNNPEYEDIQNYQPQDHPPTDIITATCPAYMPTVHQNQPPTDADAYEEL